MIEVLKQMVEALEVDAYVYNGEKSWAAIQAGKQAIAELESQEPLAWGLADKVRQDLDRQSCPDAFMRIAVESIVKHHPAQPAPVQEPVGEFKQSPHGNYLQLVWKTGYVAQQGDKLYTTPPAQPAQRTWVGLDWLPEHKCGLHLSHNEHRDVYETIENFYDPGDFVSAEEWLKAVAGDSVWVLHWYPNTPVGFNRIAASTLEAIEAKLKENNNA